MRSSQTCRQGQRSKHANASLQLHSCIVGLAVLQHWGILIKAKTPAATARSPPRSRLQEQQALNTCTVSGGKQNQQQGEVQWCCIILGDRGAGFRQATGRPQVQEEGALQALHVLQALHAVLLYACR
jgi:hypothetical protein